MKALRHTVAAGAFAALCGCEGQQSALDPAGIQAERISHLWWWSFWGAAAVYVLVMLFVVVAVVRHYRPPHVLDAPELEPPTRRERGLMWGVGGAVVVTIAVLFALLISDFVTGRRVHSLGDAPALRIRVIGHQWWWEVEYQDPTPSNLVKDANEIHLPVGRPVEIQLESRDVIHSFWVPNLHGKKDLIPGHPTQTYLRADRPGTYIGQCAEYCGMEHAYMRLIVTAEPEEQFQAWLARQRQSAPEPNTQSAQRGRQVFLGATCILCHTIQGTSARATVGPDLTHVAGRTLIGGVLHNTRGNLGGWIVDPQRIKPGVLMPPNPLGAEDLRALLDYLETLK